MRIVVLLLYIVSLFPLPGIETTLCVSSDDVVFEGLHIPEAAFINSDCSHSIETSCDYDDSHHSHGDCYDYEDFPVRERSKTYKANVALIEISTFEKLFADAPFRAPPVITYDHHELPLSSQLQIVRSTVILC